MLTAKEPSRQWPTSQAREYPAKILALADGTSVRAGGQRFRAAIPHGHWKTVTFVDGLTPAGFIAPIVLDGPMDGEAFRAWREQMLAPVLRPGHLVIMGNLAAHKVAGVRQAPARLL